MADALDELELLMKSNSHIPSLIRKSNMIRHQFVRIPLLNYTNYDGSLIEGKTEFKFQLDSQKLDLSPRFVHFDECYMFASSEFREASEISPHAFANFTYWRINKKEIERIKINPRNPWDANL